MATVTEISPSPRREGRFDVMVDGSAVATLSLDAVERLHLTAGILWTDPLASAVEHEARAVATFDRALATLARRGRAARELARLLVRKGEPAPLVDAAIERLTTLGLLDDLEYARGLVRSKIAGPGHSVRRLRTELLKRGVARDVADRAIADVAAAGEVDPTETLERVARKKLATLRSVAPDVRKRRLWAFLARRGFDSDEIRVVVSRLLDDGDEADRST